MHKTSQWLVYNGNLQAEESSSFSIRNRAFKLGDGFFESMRVIDSVPHLWDAHYARITSCCKALNLQLPNHFTSDFLLDSVSKLLKKSALQNGARVRFTFFREGDGTYRPTTSKAGFVLEASRCEGSGFNVRDEGIQLGMYDGLRKHVDRLAKYKLLGGHVYIQASIWAEANKFDDAVILNDAGHLIEATSSNLFLVRGTEIHTPPVQDGCVGGVMRMAVINAAIDAGLSCFESQLDESDLLQSDEIFLTNAVQGISWVRSFREKRYYHKVSDRLIAKINEAHTAQMAQREAQLSVGSEGK